MNVIDQSLSGKWTTETRQGEDVFLILFKKVSLYFIVRFYPSLFQIPYDALRSAQILKGPLYNITTRT